MKQITALFIFLFLGINFISAQQSESDKDAFFIKEIYDKALTDGQGYDWLMYLTKRIGGRLSGSPQAAAAVEYTKQMMDTMNMDRVWLQPVMVPHWVRGEKEVCRMISERMGTIELNALALGNSIGTGERGVSGEVVEVMSLDEAEELGKLGKLRGKIVFYNRAFDPTQISTMAAYGGAVDQRVYGPTMAAKYGAVGALVRSMTNKTDDVPHTGSTVYQDGHECPAVAISTMAADELTLALKDEKVRVYFKTTCENLEPKLSYNVIGEIRGSEFPDEIILVGGHLDSWDVGTGAHDDGAGCVHAMDVIHILNQLDYKPKRTLRCVMYMNEENGMKGADAYRDSSDLKKEYHLAAIESDRGGFTPRGFTADGHDDIFTEKFKKVIAWLPLLEPYGLELKKGGSGADVGKLKGQKGLLFGFLPDSQRYFDYHHTPTDNPDVVNKRELELGSASITALVFLLDKYGL